MDSPLRDLSLRAKALVQLAPSASFERPGVRELVHSSDGLALLGWSYREWLVVANEDWTRRALVDALRGSCDCCVRDMSDAYCIFELRGPECVALLAHLSSVDVAAAGVNTLRRTRIAGVDGAVVVLAESPPRLWLLVDRSHGPYLEEVVAAAQPARGAALEVAPAAVGSAPRADG